MRGEKEKKVPLVVLYSKREGRKKHGKTDVFSADGHLKNGETSSLCAWGRLGENCLVFPLPPPPSLISRHWQTVNSCRYCIGTRVRPSPPPSPHPNTAHVAKATRQLNVTFISIYIMDIYWNCYFYCDSGTRFGRPSTMLFIILLFSLWSSDIYIFICA